MRIIVTGGAGFIGSHVCERLLRDGHEILIIDDFNDFYVPSLKRANLYDVQRVGSVSLVEEDICNVDAMAATIRQFQPAAVVHLAARAGVRPSIAQPFLYERVNVHGTLSLLEACRQLSVPPKFVFASSSSVYGVSGEVPFRETDQACDPISPYAATKIAGEKICYTYSHLYGFRVTCLRFFTVFGPRQRPDLAINKFTDMIYRRQEIPVFGDGSSARDYTFIADIVEGVANALHRPTLCDVFNLGNSRPIKLLDMIAAIERALGVRAVLRWLPKQPGDVGITFADISKAQRTLGYAPRTPFETGLQLFVDWYRQTPAVGGPSRVCA